ncbi:MAG: hypothetical protein GWN47_11785 [Woeseiaceae bacterium]|nr:hypothetical protein [Woeseiaceae bacterium]
MTARLLLIAAAALISTESFAQETCEQDDTGLANQLNENIVLHNARTAEDFANESLHHFFTTRQGNLDFTQLVHSIGFGRIAGIFLSVTSRIEYAYVACNDIGQCTEISMVSHYSKFPNKAATDATNSVLDFFTGGELSVGQVVTSGFEKHVFSVSTADGDRHQVEVFEHTPYELEHDPEKFRVRGDNDPLVTDKRCRNNFGELAEGQPVLPASGGGYQPPPQPDSPGFWRRAHTGWHCFADATGVVCRKTYDYVWVIW